MVSISKHFEKYDEPLLLVSKLEPTGRWMEHGVMLQRRRLREQTCKKDEWIKISPGTCNESVFSLSLCSSDERKTSLYISAASTKSPTGDKRRSCPLLQQLNETIRHYVTEGNFNRTYQDKKHEETKMRLHLGLCFECIPMGNRGAEGG